MGGRRVTVGNATTLPVAFWGPKAKSLGRRPFSLFWFFSLPSSTPRWGKVSVLPLRQLDLGEAVAALVRSGSIVMERGGGGLGFMKTPLGVRFFICCVGRSGVGPQFGRTAVVVVVLCCGSLASPYRGDWCKQLTAVSVTRSLVSSMVAPECGRACGETVLLTWLIGVSRGDTWLFLPDLVEVRDVGACVLRLWSYVVAPVFRELLCLGGCVPRCCFRIEFDFAGSAGVISCCSGWSSLPDGRGVGLFAVRCQQCELSVGGGTTIGVFGGGPGVDLIARVLVRCSRSSSLLVLVEVRFPQNCVVLCSFPELLVVVLVRFALRTNGFLVVLVEPYRWYTRLWSWLVFESFPLALGIECVPLCFLWLHNRSVSLSDNEDDLVRHSPCGRVVVATTVKLRCNISSFASALLEFLLLWLVRDWLSLLSLVHEAHPPTLFRWRHDLRGPWRGFGMSGCYNCLDSRWTSMVTRLLSLQIKLALGPISDWVLQ
ncbi:hypothetical protein Taro_039769 [Colocasia esculenta]|uniref:Uncharacterized protein n=1 Tax=Colocasia esculenta TaxID=4460 RepID=A0A843WGQ6_COLES|nr:hypothetical protein [Colocasia esculenta]